MKRLIGAAVVAGTLVLAGSAAILRHRGPASEGTDVGRPDATDLSARRYYRHHYHYGYRPYYRPYSQPYYYARPTYYRPYPYSAPAPFPLGFGFGPSWW